MTLNCTHVLVDGGSSLLQKKINQQNLNNCWGPLLEFCHLRIFFYRLIFFMEKSFWAQVLKNVFRGLLSNHDIQWVKLTQTPQIHTKFYILGNFSGFQKWQNSISGSDETEIFIYKVPFTLHLLVELIHNSTICKRTKKLDKSMPSKKSLKVSFVTSGTQKVEDFFVFAHIEVE